MKPAEGEAEARLLAWLGVGWAVLAVAGAALFAYGLAPGLGDTFAIETLGRRGRLNTLLLDTRSFAIVQLVVAVVVLLLCVLAVLGVRKAPLMAMCNGLLTAMLVPLAAGVVFTNAVIPAESAEVLAGYAYVSMFAGAFLGGASILVGVVIVHLRQVRMRRPRPTEGAHAR